MSVFYFSMDITFDKSFMLDTWKYLPSCILNYKGDALIEKENFD